MSNGSALLRAGVLAACCWGLAGWGRAAQVQLNGRTFTLPDGFTIEEVAGPPVVDRPIVADFDEQGRLYVDDSSGSSEPVQKQLKEKPHRVLRLEDTKGRGHFDKSTVFADHMMFPEGAMWYDGSVYVGAPPSIWKLTDTVGNGVANQRSEWFQGKTLTGCANDIHGPYLGPDGWIYWCKGAFAEQTYERPGRKPFVTRAAHVFRARPDGSGIEPVMTGGMDNPVHVVFTPGGERIFTTTFLVNPAGGQRDGIIHAIYGGIYGKVHDVTDDHPHTSPDLMPVLVHLGPAAACGLCRYESDVLGPEFQNNLLASSFNLHKVTRHVLKPDGATFAATNEDFLACDSLDFHPTDVIEDADGSLLVIDTGGWYKLCCPTSQIGKPDVLGAIYRIRRAGAPRVDDPRGLKLDWTSTPPESLAGFLDDRRSAVRKRAVQALAERKGASLQAIERVLRTSMSSLARVNAVWAATRIDDLRAREIARIALKDSDETVRQAAAHSASVWRDRAAFDDLLALLQGTSAPNRRVASEALGRLGDARAVPHLLKALSEPHDRVLDHSLTYALIEIDDAKATTGGLASDDPRVRRSTMIALDQMDNGGIDPGIVAEALNAPDSALRETAAWIAARHADWGNALAAALHQRITSALDLAGRDRLQFQLARLAPSQAIQKLLTDQLADQSASANQKRLALGAMAQSGLKEPPPEWIQGVFRMLGGDDSALLPDAVDALARMSLTKEDIEQASRRLLAIGSREDLSADVRLRALNAVSGGVSEIDDGLFTFLTAQATPRQPAERRLRAAHVLGKAKLNPAQLSALTDTLTSAGPLEIAPVLSAYASSSDPAIGRKLADALKSAKALTSLHPALLRERLAKFGPDIQKEAEALVARLNPDTAQQKARLDQLAASLTSGDVRRGQLLFNSSKLACASCHAIGYVGGHVGPDLTRVGAIRSQRDLLESIVYPSASFVRSFEPTMVITTSDDRQYGIIRGNNADEILLVTGPTQEVRISRKDIKEMRPGTISLMPAGLGEQLSTQELSDLIAFLKACQ